MTKRLILATAGAVVLAVILATAAFTLTDDDSRPMMGRDRPAMGMWGDRVDGPLGRSVPRTESAYLVEMVAHHEEAVTAARELARSERADLRELGRSIVASQTAQIELMRGWLAEWYPDAGPADYEPMMRDLDGLEGDELDRTFLEDMVGHHMAAVMMSQHLLMWGDDVHPEVAELAGSIRDEQHREIVMMTRWLREWFGASWSGGPHMMGGMMR